jgi:UDP-2,3-diacylglucosamine pyrophosphatase LpxH
VRMRRAILGVFEPLRLLKRLTVLLGIVSPLALIGWLFSLHGMREDVGNYTPLLREFQLVAGAGLLVLLLALIELYLRRGTERMSRFPSNQLTVLATIVALAVVGFAGYIFIPFLSRHGNLPPQIILEEGAQAGGASFPLRIAVGSDPHFGAADSRTDRTIKMLGIISDPASKYQAFFLLGDLVQLGFNDAMWQQALLRVSTVTSTIPSSFVLGNHDAMFHGYSLYRKYLCPPGQRTFWRRIDIGKVHFLELDLEYGLLLYTPEQEAWLKKQLAEIPRADWCVVMCHTFFYCSGERKDGWDWFDNKPLIAKIVPLFEQYGVDLVLSGHQHQAEVLKMNGVTYGVFGSFGGHLDAGRTYTSPASVWYQDKQHCFAEIDFDNSKTGRLLVRDDNNKVMFETGLVNR